MYITVDGVGFLIGMQRFQDTKFVYQIGNLTIIPKLYLKTLNFFLKKFKTPRLLIILVGLLTHGAPMLLIISEKCSTLLPTYII